MPSEAATKRALALAAAIVIDLPERRGESKSAYVRYALLDMLADALTACGINVVEGRERMKTLRTQPGEDHGKAKDDR